MKGRVRFIQNLLLTLVLVGGMIGIYLYAGKQEAILAADQTEPSAAPTAVPAPPDVSGDGRLKQSVLSVLCDAGYTLTEKEDDCFLVHDRSGDLIAELLLSTQGDRVNGMTLRTQLPTKPKLDKKPTLSQKAAQKRYENDLQTIKQTLPKLLQAALDAIDPYTSVPSTTRFYWESLLIEAVDGDRTASDTGEEIAFRVYETEMTVEEKQRSYLCLLLQLK